MGLLEPDAGHGRGDDEGGLSAEPSAYPVVIVHDLGHARAALAAARRAGRGLTLASPPGAAATLGPLVFRETVAAARAAEPGVTGVAILDCGDAAGLALAAIRAGVEAISLDGRADVVGRVAEIAAAGGCRLLPRPAPDLDLATAKEPEAALAALFAASKEAS